MERRGDGGHGIAVLTPAPDDGGPRGVRQLTELGYRVLEAEDVETALKVLESERVDLLFTDIVIPGGTSGDELAHMAQSRWPDIKILLTSGFPDNKIRGNDKLPNVRLPSKPYRRDDLARTIREVLEPIHKVVESEESVMIPSLAPDSALRGAGCGSLNIAVLPTATACATRVI
jgi:two-component SAPR family response regulator